jgi:hypothetical protein
MLFNKATVTDRQTDRQTDRRTDDIHSEKIVSACGDGSQWVVRLNPAGCKAVAINIYVLYKKSIYYIPKN